MSRQDANPLFAPLEERILGLLLLRPERAWYRSELGRELEVRPSSLQRPLARLTRSGILRSFKDGNRVYYQAEVQSPVFREVQALLLKTSGLVGVLRDALEGLAPKIRFAFVYGSIAAREEVASSDVDVFVVGSANRSALAIPLREAASRLGREVNSTVYSEAEFRKKARGKDRFLRGLLDKPRLFVLGTEDDVAAADIGAEGR